MSAARDLPARPSLDSLRKQAKRLARDIAAGNGEAHVRVHAQMPRAKLPLSNRDAQLVVAREYGFVGWPELTAEVQKRVGNAIEWAASEAQVAIHHEDHERLRTLLAEYPALVSWRDESDQMLLDSTTSYAMDCSDADIALRLLERAIALDPELGRRIDRWQRSEGRKAFVEFLAQQPGLLWHEFGTPWETFVILQLASAR